MDLSCSVEMSESVMKFVETSPLLGSQEFDLTLTWQNLTVKVKQKNVHKSAGNLLKNFYSWKKSEEITILDNVSGKLRSGNLIAVLGASGTGKTSLLAAVSSRIQGNVTGTLLVCDRHADGSLLTRISGFVPQQDIVIETLTAREHLQFMSWMRLDRELPDDIRNKWICALLQDLNLAGCEDVCISSLSTGERRRLSLAVELLTDPPLLFCDEPTTGLDSYNASTVVEKLHHLASRGKAVLCSIHQPASDTLSCFHKVILLAGSGRVAFQGSLAQAYTFFANQGFVCPPTYNPAEFYIHKLSIIPGEEEDSAQRINQLCEAYSNLEQDESLELSLPHIQAAHNSITEISNDFQKYIKIRKPHWNTQVYWLTWRSILDSNRKRSGHAVKLAVFLVTSVILTLCFMSSEVGTQSWVQDMRGLLYLITSEVYFTCAFAVFYTFPGEISVFLREAGLYSASAYYFSKMLTVIPKAVIEPLIFLAIIFIFVDFASSSITLFFLLAGPILIIANTATAYGCMLSALFESPEMITAVAVPIDLLALLMAGIFYNIRVLPAAIIWLKYLSQFYYSNEVLAVVHWQTVEHIKCPNDTSLPCLENGQQVLNEYGFEKDNLFRDLAVLAVFYIILHFIGFLGVWRRSKKEAAY